MMGFLCSSLLPALLIAPAFGQQNDVADRKSSPPITAENELNATVPDASSTKANPSPSPSSTPSTVSVTGLLNMLVTKGVITIAEASAIRGAAPGSEFRQLAEVLRRKGLLSADELSAIMNPGGQPAAPLTTAAVTPEAALAVHPKPQEGFSPPAQEIKPPSVVAGIAPVRVLPLDPPAKDGLAGAIKLGAVKMTPYGFLKATAAHDSSSPNDDDFPFVGLFLSSTSILNTGPTTNPEFHLKARSARLGANFEWPDASPKLSFTGRIEGDYEGNFSEVDNRDISSIRSNAFQLRLGYVRMGFAASDKTDVYFEGGQDWTLFGSSALPNILETTFLGAYYGTIYERSPQMIFGAVRKLGGDRNFKISPAFAIMMPSSGQIEKLGMLGLAGQIGQGEREGADSGSPELEGRLALQFQLDRAPAVAPAQLIWSGFYGTRKSLTTNSNYTGSVQPSCMADAANCAAYQAAYPNGFTVSGHMYGDQLVAQLPTRWATLVVSGYRGGDLRFFFGGQVNSFYTDTGGLHNPVTFATVDGGPLAAAGPSVLACSVAVTTPLTVCPSSSVTIAPEKPVRSFGGFVNLGLPTSRSLVQCGSKRAQRRLAALFARGQRPGSAQGSDQCQQLWRDAATVDGQDVRRHLVLQGEPLVYFRV